MIEINGVDHIGIRVSNLERAMSFYALLVFELHFRASGDAVVIAKNFHGIEINLIYNANTTSDGKNILMDFEDKYPGYTHVAMAVASLSETTRFLEENNLKITQGPVDMGGGQLSVFIRDPDMNVIELRGTAQANPIVEGVVPYNP